MTRNYQEKLWREIIRRNYDAKLSASIYYVTENVKILGILTYPKMLYISNIIFIYYKVEGITQSKESSNM